MRKRYKVKKHSCAMCKPNKMGHCIRWSPKALQELKLAEKAIRNA